MRSRGRRIGALAVVVLLVACGDPYRKELHDGFPSGIGIMVDGDEERNVRGVLGYYHVPPAGIDCMVEAIRAAGRFTTDRAAAPPTAIGDRPTLVLTGEELNGYARGCGVDVTDLWYMSD